MVAELLRLPAHQTRRLSGPLTLLGRGGHLRVTLDGQPEDIVLATGERLHIQPGAAAVAYALGADAQVEIRRDERALDTALAAASAPAAANRRARSRGLRSGTGFLTRFITRLVTRLITRLAPWLRQGHGLLGGGS